MTPEDSKRFRSAMAELFVLYDRPADEVRTRLYWQELREFPIEAVLAAMAKAKRECEFFPSVARLRQAITGTAQDEAEAAWLALLETVRRVGSYRQAVLPPAMRDAVDALYGSWQAACREIPSPDRLEHENHRRRFLAAFKTVQLRTSLPTAGVAGLLEG